jgi:hypothetical protein
MKNFQTTQNRLTLEPPRNVTHKKKRIHVVKESQCKSSCNVGTFAM